MLEEAAAARRNETFDETEDVTRVYGRFFTSSEVKVDDTDSPAPETGPSLKAEPILETEPLVVDSPAPKTSPSPSARPARETRQSRRAGPAQKDGFTESAHVALQINGPLTEDGPAPGKAPPAFSLLNSLPGVDGHHLWFNEMDDYLFPHLTPNEQALYKQLYRLTWGFDRPRCVVNFPRLSERSGMSESGARVATRSLISKGLIEKCGLVFGKNREQGILWEVFEPPALKRYRAARRAGPVLKTGPALNDGPSPPAPMKHVEKQNTQTQPGAGVGSRFTLEECRRYADHLKATGQGITNPGGYATKVYRSGEADTLIDAFLNPPAPLDASLCPDCQGRGFAHIDPENFDLGVRPCKHPRLQ